LANRIPITVRLDRFEGPLDLLLYLIQSHELDISRVAISQITDQYLAYVRLMQELNFDTASEFLVMAATLVHWKSRALLPQDPLNGKAGEDADAGPLSQEELILQLLQHQRYLEAGENLAQLPHLGIEVFTRANRKPPVERVWPEMNLTDLAMAYQDTLVRSRKRTHVLRKETVSITDKIMEFADKLSLNQLTELRTLLNTDPTRGEIVATFLATLELGRLKKMKLFQEQAYASIYVELLETLKNFDVKLAQSFENVANAIAAEGNGP
jgi:segregation and condensation protein A